LDGRLERLTDAVVDGLIDRESYLVRKEKLLSEKLMLEERARDALKDAPSRDHLRQFFELIKSLKNLFISALPSDRREIVEIATSNRTVMEKNVRLEPSNWLRTAQNMLSVYSGDPHRSTFRSLPEVQNEQETPYELERYLALCKRIYDRMRVSEGPTSKQKKYGGPFLEGHKILESHIFRRSPQ
jgi:hypothetical protein